MHTLFKFEAILLEYYANMINSQVSHYLVYLFPFFISFLLLGSMYVPVLPGLKN